MQGSAGDRRRPTTTDDAALFILHRRRARKFYDLLNDTGDKSVTVCFDMMQNLSLPKTPIGQAYYSRQLSLYVFAVVVHRGRGNGQPKQDVHLYVWQENENRKDSNIVASALNDCLRHHLPGLRDVGLLRLFSDSCFGQNKNMNGHAVSPTEAVLPASRRNVRVPCAWPQLSAS